MIELERRVGAKRCRFYFKTATADQQICDSRPIAFDAYLKAGGRQIASNKFFADLAPIRIAENSVAQQRRALPDVFWRMLFDDLR